MLSLILFSQKLSYIYQDTKKRLEFLYKRKNNGFFIFFISSNEKIRVDFEKKWWIVSTIFWPIQVTESLVKTLVYFLGIVYFLPPVYKYGCGPKSTVQWFDTTKKWKDTGLHKPILMARSESKCRRLDPGEWRSLVSADGKKEDTK